MLVLTRKPQEVVVVGGSNTSGPVLTITVLGIEGTKVRLGFQSDSGVPVHRLEVWQRILTEGPRESPTPDPASLGAV